MKNILIEVHGPDLEIEINTLESIAQLTSKALLEKHSQIEIHIQSVSSEAIQTLNRQHRHKNKPTNILSFPYHHQEQTRLFLGDIVICLDRVREEAHELNKPACEHLIHLFVHGLLHLLGYDHENEKEALLMEAKETEILRHFNQPDPYT